jgi:ABC-2 type transport system permease protein
MAYFVTGIFLLLTGASFSMYLAGTSYSDTSIRGFLDAAPFVVLAFAALFTMRLIAEERKLATWEFLMTAPVSELAIVLGKYLGSLAVFAGMLALTLLYPLLLAIFGDPDLGPIATSYFGLLLLGSAALAVGIFASAVTSNQLGSAALAGAILLALWFLGGAAALLPARAGQALAYLSLSRHMPDFARGVVDTRSVLYLLSLAAVFLYLAVRAVEADRWR